MNTNSSKSSDNFFWSDKSGYGYYPVTNDGVYNDSYFDKYVRYEQTTFGRELNEFRVDIVKKFVDGAVLDIGVGCGSFIKLHGNAYGFDVCKKAVEWLKDSGLYLDPYSESLANVEALTFFDSLEHIGDLWPILKRAQGKSIVASIPVFESREATLKSKHFRPDEHYHYFTIEGFQRFMDLNNFRLRWISDYETQLGRDSIMTFVFAPR